MNLTERFKIHYWPGLTVGLFLFTIIVTYLIAVLDGHVYPLFPYISDSGTVVPESCYFGQLLNIIAVCLGITHYIRYRQVDIAIDNGDIKIQKKWNRIGLLCAYVYVMGVTIAANFQETAVLVIHFIGATMVFTGGGLGYGAQTLISMKSLRNSENSNQQCGITKRMLYLRIIIVVILCPLGFVVGVTCILGLLHFKDKLDRINWWTEEDGGFETRLVSTFGEWIYILLMFLYLATFTNEFKSITFTGVGFTSTKSNNNKSLSNDVV